MIIYRFTFMHLAEYFIQSNVKVTHFTSMCFPKESNPLLWCCLLHIMPAQYTRSNNTIWVQIFTQRGITDIKHNLHLQLWSHNGALKL